MSKRAAEDTENETPTKRITRSTSISARKLSSSKRAPRSLAAVVVETPKKPKTPKITEKQVATPKTQVPATPKTPFDIYKNAKTYFRACNTPLKLVGRQGEKTTIAEFWDKNSTGGASMYISGFPGTGKTALLNEIIREKRSIDNAKQFKIITLNCMTLKNPKLVHTALLDSIKNRETTSVNPDADILLEKIFISKKSKTTYVVILDEIDYLVSKDQEILYRLFEWPTLPGSKLLLFGIANTLDLTGRFLPRLRSKNCEPVLLNFKPYEINEITEIIKSRFQNIQSDHSSSIENQDPQKRLPLIQPSALEYLSRKVVASGDLRKALDVCRKSIEAVEQEYKRKHPVKSEDEEEIDVSDLPKVSIQHVVKVANAAFGTANSNQLKIRELHFQHKLAVVALVCMEKRLGKDDITSLKLSETVFAFCKDKHNHIPSISRSEFQDILPMLEAHGIVTMFANKKKGASPRVSLNIHPNDVRAGVEDNMVLKGILERDDRKL